MRNIWLCMILTALDPIPVSVPERSEPVAYAEVADILAAKCLGCHATGLEKGRLNLETVDAMRRGGKHGAALVPGKAEESLMFLRAAHRSEPVMPPKDKPEAEPMTSEELGLLKLWIDSGARDEGSPSREARPATLGTLPPGVHPINSVDVTADGRLIACGRANLVQVYDSETGRELVSLAGHDDLIQAVRFSPDGSKLAAGSYERVTVWLVGAKPADWREWLRLAPHADRVQALDFNPDGTLLAAGAGEPSRSGQVTIWETGKGMLVRRLEGLHTDSVMALRFSPDGKTLASGSADKLVKLINVADGRERATLEGHTHHVLGLDWRPDGQQVVSASADGILKFWDSGTGEVVRSTNPLSKPITGVRWSRIPGDNFVAASSGDHRVHLWNPRNGAELRAFGQGDDYLFSLSVASTRPFVAVGGSGGTLYLWDSSKSKLLRTMPRLEKDSNGD
jgi:WD40 repeat protein